MDFCSRLNDGWGTRGLIGAASGKTWTIVIAIDQHRGARPGADH